MENASTAGIPREAAQAYRTQRNSAKRRGIPFLFSLPEWWAWWQVDGRWERRGRRTGGLVMARCEDRGPYSAANVYCTTHEANVRAAAKPEVVAPRVVAAWAARKARGDVSHLTNRAKHPRNRAVITPTGRFANAALAAEAFGLTRQGAALRAREGGQGWRYEDD